MQKTITQRLGVLYAVVLTAFGLLLAPQLAHAHDVLTDSTPEMDSTVETTPQEVRLQFSGQPLDGEGLSNLIRVTDDQDNQWQDGDVSVEGYELAVPLCEGLPQGDYSVTYRVVYSDGHTGEEGFSFTNADPEAPESGAPEDCGEVSDDAATADQSAPADNESSATSNADQPADENTSTTLPVWLWIAGGVGVVVIVAVVLLVMRGSGTNTGPDESSEG
ncbi:MAG TPA: copper resistance protein CopC [Candidatus Yaniella excrementigallinarum]|nr:copper resistance protein CopC [Candidatus Yaniella excrementigallinarum]